MAAHVTPAHRFALWRMMDGHTAASVHGRIIRAATYWESFPGSYSAEQVDAAQRLHLYVRAVGSAEWDRAFCDVARLAGVDFPALHRVGGE